MKRAFTLIELVTTLAIVGILVAMIIPAVQSVRESSKRANCLNRMRQLVLAGHNFEAAHGHLPPTLSDSLLHWQAQCLPFLDQQPIHDHIKGGLATVHPYDSPFFSKTIPVLQCPSNPDEGLVIEANVTGAVFAFTDYCGVAGSNEVRDDGLFSFKANKPIAFESVLAGLSNTFMFGERPPNPIEHGFGMWLGSQWGAAATMSVTNDGNIYYFPSECGFLRFRDGIRFDECDAFHHWSYHPGGGNFSRAGGSVAFVSYDIETDILVQLGSRNH